ncbi:MAG TPA: hypothetical protein VHO07_26065 [Streptosporangiaceae bacterium]|nr:hypothetical protein [Streptosporangiaceae bacterium]
MSGQRVLAIGRDLNRSFRWVAGLLVLRPGWQAGARPGMMAG